MDLLCTTCTRAARNATSHSLAIAGLALTAALAGCGGNASSTNPGQPTQPGNATVVLMLTATGNDRLTSFSGALNSLTLTSQSGQTVTLFASSPYEGSPELHHLNGATEPYLTVSVPEDTYTSATLTMGYTQFSCMENVPGPNGGLTNSIYADQAVAASNVTVTLSPITITGATGLALNLQEAASATFPASCAPTGLSDYTITPTFQLTPLPFGDPSNALDNSEATTLHGTIASVTASGASLTVALPDGPTIPVTVPANTTFQGVGSASALTVGEPVDVDINFAADASISASRIEVFSTNPASLTTALGTVAFVGNALPVANLTLTQTQGSLTPPLQVGNTLPFSFGSATFAIDGGSAILLDLPFTPTFTADTMVPGQNVLATTYATAIAQGPLYIPATTLTLMPQVVNGTLVRVQVSGQLTTYTVTLAPYDSFNQFAVQPGQNSLIASPGTMQIYTYQGNDGLQSSSLVPGQPFRFTGLVFNDNGVLRMACSQILAGVAL